MPNELNNGAVNTESSNEAVDTESRTYTQEEVDKLLQAETDRRVADALKKNTEKVKEAERLSHMSAEEQLRHELDELKAELAESARQKMIAENKSAASKVLADKGLSPSLVDLVVADNADVMNANIKLLEKAFKESVKNEVEARLRSKSPNRTLIENKEYTSKDLMSGKLSLSQMQELRDSQPELFD